jgi:hypothetical protein
MSKHTPGPWLPSGKSVVTQLGATVAHCGESCICSADGYQSIQSLECLENAKLIAAARQHCEAIRCIIKGDV